MNYLVLLIGLSVFLVVSLLPLYAAEFTVHTGDRIPRANAIVLVRRRRLWFLARYIDAVDYAMRHRVRIMGREHIVGWQDMIFIEKKR